MEDVSSPADEFFFLCLDLGVIPKNSTSWEIHQHFKLTEIIATKFEETSKNTF